MNIKEQLINDFKLREDQLASHETDLHILPDDDIQLAAISTYLAENRWSHDITFSNVEGQPWFGKRFIDVPFALMDEKFGNETK